MSIDALSGLPQALSSIQMIIVCIFTDVAPALSMVYEKPEADLLLRKPRDRKKERLVNFKLLLHAYGFIGVLESLTSMIGYACLLHLTFRVSMLNGPQCLIVHSISASTGMASRSQLCG